MFKQNLSALVTAFALTGAALHAQPVDYHVSVKTGDDGVNREVLIQMFGSKGTTGRMRLDGSFDRHDVDETVFEQIDDIGPVHQITLWTVASPLPFGIPDPGDDWMIGNVTITRGSRVKGSASQVGLSTFTVNRKIHAGHSATAFATTINREPVTVSREGTVHSKDKHVTVAHFHPNSTSGQITVMKTEETWSTANEVAVSTERATSTSVNAAVTAGFDANGFGASTTVGAAWESALVEARTDVESKGYTKTQSWSYTVEPFTGKFRSIDMNVPTEYALYQTSDANERRWIRMPAGPITDLGTGDVQEIPQVDRQGNIIPVAWSSLEDRFMKHMDEANRARVMAHRGEWIEKGYVVLPGAPSSPKSPSSGPAPLGPTKAASLPQPKTASLPKSKPAVAIVPPPEDGVYKDDLGFYMEVTVSGSKFAVKNLSPETMTSWTTAAGRIVDTKMHVLYTDGSKRDTTTVGTIKNSRRIEFGNGHWQYFGADADAIPVADLVADFKKFVHAGGKVTVQLRVTNRGDAPAAASTAQVWLSRNKKVDPRRDTGLGEQPVPELAPGASAMVTFSRKLSAEKADGMRVCAMLDTGDAVAESNEENSFRGGMKLQSDRKGSSERAQSRSVKRESRSAKKAKKKSKKGGKKRRK